MYSRGHFHPLQLCHSVMQFIIFLSATSFKIYCSYKDKVTFTNKIPGKSFWPYDVNRICNGSVISFCIEICDRKHEMHSLNTSFTKFCQESPNNWIKMLHSNYNSIHNSKVNTGIKWSMVTVKMLMQCKKSNFYTITVSKK